MPADKKEVNEAKNEDIEFIFQTNILKINENDIEVIKTELICDGNNRPKPVNIPDTNYHIDSDYVISCIGSEPDNIIKLLGLELDEWNYIKVDENYRTSNKKIFAGGDIANCKQTIAFAASSGIKAANSIINEIKD
jgi:glutamate synthase (NADPH/NADH) small chain